MKTSIAWILIVTSVGCFAQELPKMKAPTTVQPILVVDGIKYLHSDSTNALQNLDPEKIKEIKILKGQEALDQFGEDGQYGVVVVTTKTGLANQPLYLLDGKRIDDISSINPNDIQSIEVIKDPVHLQPYGDSGKMGVIKITLKKK